jgi:transmembrane sensor
VGEPRRNAHVTLERVDPSWDAARVEVSLAALHRRRAQRRARVTVGALGLLLVTGLAWSATPEAVVPAHTPDRIVHLADGSVVSPDDGARVVVDHVAPDRIAIQLEQGAAEFDVAPHPERTFVVTSGEVTVTVVGTAFRVERVANERVHVRVSRGHVRVSWRDGDADLLAGEDGTYPPEHVAPSIVDGLPLAPPSSIVPPPTTARAPARAQAPSWRDLADASRYGEAYAAMSASDARPDAARATVDDLLLAADVARLSGHPQEASDWLEAIERDHAGDPRAVLAAFTRGRLLMSVGRPADAALEFERVVEREPNGAMTEDAIARAALARAAAGEHGAAVALAERYLGAYPSGRWSSRVRAITEDGATE